MAYQSSLNTNCPMAFTRKGKTTNLNHYHFQFSTNDSILMCESQSEVWFAQYCEMGDVYFLEAFLPTKREDSEVFV